MRGSSLILLSLQFVSAWAAAAASNPTAAAPRLKVLCMHGYSQNGAVLRDRSGGFRKPFKMLQPEDIGTPQPIASTSLYSLAKEGKTLVVHFHDS